MACELYCCLLPQCEALRICRSGFPIATALTKKGVGTHPKKLAIFKQLRTNLKAKHKKGVGTRFPRVPAQFTPGHK